MAVISPTPLTDTPPFPALSDRSTGTYNSKAYAFGTHMSDTFNAELDALAGNVFANATDAAASAATAEGVAGSVAALANYKGNWSSLTGALAMPASVSHIGSFWVLNTGLANVALDEPGVSASWTLATTVGNGGANVTSSAVDVTLTKASARVQSLAMTAAEKALKLPDASTLTTGGVLFSVRNTGALPYRVLDAANGLVSTLDSGQTVMLYLVDASTAAGVWTPITNDSALLSQSIYQGGALVVNAAASTHISITTMSATKAIAVWVSGTFLNACTLNISGSTVTAGAVLVVNAISSTLSNVVSLSGTKAIIAYVGASNYLNAITLDVSGTTLTAGTNKVVNALATSNISICATSATEAVVMCQAGANVLAYHLTATGGVITNGTAATVYAGTSPTALSAVSPTLVLASLSYAVSGQAVLLSISGTTITPNTFLGLVFGAFQTSVFASVLSPTQAIFAGAVSPGGLFQIRQLGISGTTLLPTGEGFKVITSKFVTSPRERLQKISANKLLLGFASASAGAVGGNYQLAAMPVVLNDEEFSFGVTAHVKNAYSPQAEFDISVMSEKQSLAVYAGTSGYLNARLLEMPL